jgi:5-methylcytosine-specific restriction endonuclease McrBC regulatory subunit McrC
MRTTDNNGNGKSIEELLRQDFDEVTEDKLESTKKNLRKIANTKINEIKLEDNPNLLVFPRDWVGGVKDKYGKYSKICDVYDSNIKTGNIMGFVGVKETELTISSRFYHDGNDFFLHYMLCKVFSINVVNLDISKGTNDIHDFLPYLFPALLNDALKQGLFKQYQRFQHNDANVKGTIDVNRHIRVNIPFAGKIAYNTREHSYDNSITQLIRHTIEYLRTRSIGHSVLTSNPDVRADVTQIEFATPTYKRNDVAKIIRENLKPVKHPYFTKYKPLQALCLQILNREKTTFGKDDKKIHGLLFDGAWLWEEYIAKVFEENKLGIEHRTTTNNLFTDGQGIIPDFIKPVKGTKSASFIGDTKYKHIDNKDNREDYFQIITYMYRYSCKTGYLIFPLDNDNNQEFSKGRDRKIANDAGDSKVIELGLTIPQDSNKFKVFCDLMRTNENQLKSTIESNL